MILLTKNPELSNCFSI